MTTIVGIILVVIFSLLLLFLFVFWVYQIRYSFATDRIVFFPTFLGRIKQPLMTAIAKYVPNTTNYNLIELGCGFGHVLKFLSKTFVWKSTTGVEIDTITLQVARLNFWGNKTTQLVQADILEYSIPDDSVIYCFLGSQILTQLYASNQLSNHLVISLDFKIQELEPTETIHIPGISLQKHLYIYDFR